MKTTNTLAILIGSLIPLPFLLGMNITPVWQTYVWIAFCFGLFVGNITKTK